MTYVHRYESRSERYHLSIEEGGGGNSLRTPVTGAPTFGQSTFQFLGWISCARVSIMYTKID